MISLSEIKLQPMKLAEGDSAANFIGPNSAPLCARAKRAREWKTGVRKLRTGNRLWAIGKGTHLSKHKYTTQACHYSW